MIRECETCGGTGQDMTLHLYPTGHTEVWVACADCDGVGEVEIEEPGADIMDVTRSMCR